MPTQLVRANAESILCAGSYGFGDAWSYTETPDDSCDLEVYPGNDGDQHCVPTFAFRNAGLLYHGLSTWDATERYAMYKSHIDDPLTFQDGGKLLYRIGDYLNATAHTGRCQTLDSGPGVHPSGCVCLPSFDTSLDVLICGLHLPPFSLLFRCLCERDVMRCVIHDRPTQPTNVTSYSWAYTWSTGR